MAGEQPYPPSGYKIADTTDPFEVATGPFYCPEAVEEPPHFLFRAEPRHCNAFGVIHGGALMTLADLALCATAHHGHDDEGAITVSMNTDFLAAGHEGDLVTARAEVLRRSGSLVFMRCIVSAGDRAILNCSAVVKRMRRK
jgi:uncharacterized protein (TIGR00369 family)